MFVSHLNLDEELGDFTDSWLRSLADPEFISILRIHFYHLSASGDTEFFARNSVERLYGLLNERFGPESKKELEWLIGKSLVQMRH